MALAGSQEHTEQQTAMNERANNFSFQLVDDEFPRMLSAYRGDVVLLNFWATWCQPCVTELPELDRLQEDYRTRGLTVITVSDEPRDVLLRYADLLPKSTVSGFLTIDDLPQPYRAALERGRPVSYIIDREGYLRRDLIGAGRYTLFEQMIKPYLAQEVRAES